LQCLHIAPHRGKQDKNASPTEIGTPQEALAFSADALARRDILRSRSQITHPLQRYFHLASGWATVADIAP
jgi:hypothetical protein